MTRPKYPKPDDNQSAIVEDLRQLGAVVWVTASLPTPVLDLVVLWRGQVRIVEVKAPGRITFTKGELESIEELERVGIEVVVAQSVEDVLAAFDALTNSTPHNVKGEMGSQLADRDEELPLTLKAVTEGGLLFSDDLYILRDGTHSEAPGSDLDTEEPTAKLYVDGGEWGSQRTDGRKEE